MFRNLDQNNNHNLHLKYSEENLRKIVEFKEIGKEIRLPREHVWWSCGKHLLLKAWETANSSLWLRA